MTQLCPSHLGDEPDDHREAPWGASAMGEDTVEYLLEGQVASQTYIPSKRKSTAGAQSIAGMK